MLSIDISPGCTAQGGYVALTAVGGGSGYYEVQLVRLVDGVHVDGAQTSDAELAQAPLHFLQLYDGDYRVDITDSKDATNTASATCTLFCYYPNPNAPGVVTPLRLDFATPQAATKTGPGSLTVQATGGTAPLRLDVFALNLTQSLVSGQPALVPNLPTGRYICAVTDSGSTKTGIPAESVSFVVVIDAYSPPPVLGCTDPAADNYDPTATQDNGSCTYSPVVRTRVFEVPPLQSLRFVQPGRLDRPAFDNTLLANEHPLDVENPGYCQLVEQGDTLTVQVLSNSASAPVLKLYPAGSNSALGTTYVGTKVQQGAGQTAAFEVYVKPDLLAGRVRLYFNDEALPLPFVAGQRITLAGTGTALDGTYPIRAVLEDPAAAVPYLQLTAGFPSGNVRLDGTLTTTYVVQAYDTYQLVVPFAAVPRGCYQARVSADDPDFGTALATSEPLEVEATHPDTLVVAYRNFDNAFGLNYSHGLLNRQRVRGRFFTRQPATQKTVLRNDDNTLVLLAAQAQQKVALETLLLPSWLHEVLALAFCHDYTSVQQVRVSLEADYTYEPVERYTLGRGTALLEVYGAFGAGNRDDLSDLETGGPFLLAGSHYLNATTI